MKFFLTILVVFAFLMSCSESPTSTNSKTKTSAGTCNKITAFYNGMNCGFETETPPHIDLVIDFCTGQLSSPMAYWAVCGSPLPCSRRHLGEGCK